MKFIFDNSSVDRRQWNMDLRHIYVLYNVLLHPSVNKALEIGSYKGASSQAFVQASLRKPTFRSYHCDIKITKQLKRILYGSNGHCVSLQQSSEDALRGLSPCDLVLVDGDHSLPTVTKEADLLLSQGVPCVVAHDTSAKENGHRFCDGPPYLKQIFSESYYVIEDNQKRPNENTDRGLFIACRQKELFDWVSLTMNELCV